MENKAFTVCKFDEGSVSIATSEKDIVIIPENYIEPLIDALKSMMLINGEGFAEVDVGSFTAYEFEDPANEIH